MDDRDEWLEGVRRWYFGGDAPAEALDDEEPRWPGRSPAEGFASRALADGPSQARSAAANSA